MKHFAYLRLLVLLTLKPACVIADSIVWDYGPATGVLTPQEGGSSVFVNMSDNQNFSDSVVFSTDTFVTGYNLFTASSHLVPYVDSFCVRFWTDNAGGPGAIINEMHLTSTNVQFVGNFGTTGGHQTDVYQISLRFEPVLLTAHTTYWVGASGLNHDIGTYGVVGPGDGRFAQMFGPNVTWLGNQFGDLTFQLLAVPEPSSFTLLTVASAVLVWFVKKNHVA